jgi:DNA adenine methylase
MALARFHAIVAGLPPSELLIQGGQLDMRYNALETMEEKKHFYYALRDEFNAHVRDERLTGMSDRIRTGMLLWFLNKTCFNGLWRENKKGQFNVPFGKRESLNLAGHDVEPVHKALKNKEIYHCDFSWAIRASRPGDLIYCDPPYHTEKDAFTSYTGDGFGKEEHTRLARELREAYGRGVHVVISNSNTEFVRDLYEWAEINEVKASHLHQQRC